MTSTITTSPNPTWFTTGLTGEPGERIYPFFGTEDGDLIGLGHQDPTEFAAAAKAYWEATDSGDPELADADLAIDVEHRYALVHEGEPDGDYGFYVSWYQEDANRTPVSAETPGAVAITGLTF